MQYVLRNHIQYGGISVNEPAVEFIKNILEKGKTILELGSGQGSTVGLGKIYTLYSVENQPEWFDTYSEHTTYINCRTKYYDDEYVVPNIPYQKGWYHPDDIFPNLPKKYDLILIDGPGCSPYGRGGFLKHIEKFNTDIPMIFDDIHVDDKAKLVMEKVSEHVGRPYNILETDTTGCTGYIL
jgi:hypothetical protein